MVVHKLKHGWIKNASKKDNPSDLVIPENFYLKIPPFCLTNPFLPEASVSLLSFLLSSVRCFRLMISLVFWLKPFRCILFPDLGVRYSTLRFPPLHTSVKWRGSQFLGFANGPAPEPPDPPPSAAGQPGGRTTPHRRAINNGSFRILNLFANS